MVGQTDPPYNALQSVTWAKGIVMGDKIDPYNLYGRDRVVSNLPGTKIYEFG